LAYSVFYFSLITHFFWECKGKTNFQIDNILTGIILPIPLPHLNKPCGLINK